MSIDLKKKTISLTEGKTVMVAESGWDFSFRFDELDKEMEKLETDDKVFKFFCVNFYPMLASCVEGFTPSAQEAYELPREVLDEWYVTNWKLNPDLYPEEFHDPIQKIVELRDGLKITMEESLGRPSFMIQFYKLELQAEEHSFTEDERGQIFQLIFYPKLAACCITDNLPSAEEVRHYPRVEINKLMEASRTLNPDWYASPEEKVEVKSQVEQSKKKGNRKRSNG
ncbi:MAG: hypothetical protein ABIO63_04135 [Casimicrobiaceae bacterium]